MAWREVQPTGTVYTFFISHRAFHPGFAESLPYAAAAVEVLPAIRLLGRIVGIAAQEVRIGMPVRARFDTLTDEVTLVHWEPA